MMLTGFSRYTCLLAPAGEDDPGPLMARSLAASRPIPALAPVPTFLLAPAGEVTLAPLLARSLADSRPIPALAPVPTFHPAPAGEDDPGSPAGQVSS
jgi:hypothetical protein